MRAGAFSAWPRVRAYAAEIGSGRGRAIAVNASSLVGTTAITSILGFGYWLAAARLFPPSSVGLASASIAAMTLLGFVGMLGMGTLLIGELQRRPESVGSLLSTAVVVAGSAGAFLGLIFASLAPLLSSEFKPLAADPWVVVLFAVGVAVTAVGLMLDSAVIGLLRGGLQLARNSVFSLVKLALLAGAGILFHDKLWVTIFTSWTLGTIISLLVVAGITLRKRHLSARHLPSLWLIRNLGWPALSHHGLNLALQAPALALPVVVTLTLTATRNASFYVAWTIASFAFVGPVALSLVLYAVGVASPSTLTRHVRFTLVLALGGALLATGVIVVAGRQVLGVFGSSYAAQASSTLVLLSLAVFPMAIRSQYVALCRISGRVGPAAVLAATGAIVEVLFAAIGARLGGLPGLSLGWLIALCLEGLVTVPAVYRVAAGSDSPEGALP